MAVIPNSEFRIPNLLSELQRWNPRLLDHLLEVEIELLDFLRGQALIEETLRNEETRFIQTLGRGLKLLDDEIAKLPNGAELPGEAAFRLHDTFGFPLDLTQDIARENQLTVDETGFGAEMAKQQERGRSSGKFSQQMQISTEVIGQLAATQFLGYEQLEISDAGIDAILLDGEAGE